MCAVPKHKTGLSYLHQMKNWSTSVSLSSTNLTLSTPSDELSVKKKALDAAFFYNPMYFCIYFLLEGAPFVSSSGIFIT